MRMDQSAIPRWNFRVPVTNFTCSTTRTIPMISFVHENWPICESKCEIDYYINCKQCGLSKRKRIVLLMGWSQDVTWCRNHVVCLKRNFTSKSSPCPINYILIIQRKYFNSFLTPICPRSDVVINELTKVIMNWQINYVRQYPVGPRPGTSLLSAWAVSVNW